MNKNKIYIALATAGLLLVPFTMRWPWSASDYVIAAILIVGTGLVLEFVLSKFKDQKKKIVAGAVVLLVALYIWAELAVGVFTSIGS